MLLGQQEQHRSLCVRNSWPPRHRHMPPLLAQTLSWAQQMPQVSSHLTTHPACGHC